MCAREGTGAPDTADTRESGPAVLDLLEGVGRPEADTKSRAHVRAREDPGHLTSTQVSRHHMG
jgi:hypothetical protein